MKEIMPNLTDGDKTLMEKLLAAGHIEYKYAKRLQIVLQRSEGHSAQEIADSYAAGRSTASAIVNRYNERGLESLLRGKTRKPGTAPASAELKNKICQTACHEKPVNAVHWSTRCLAKKFGVSRTTAHTILRERGIKPRIVKTFKFSTDEHFEEKLTDVAGLYLNPPDNAIVLCVDGKSGVQALERSAPLLPLGPRIPARQTADYFRHGTATIFAALDMLTGSVKGKMDKERKSKDFRAFLKKLGRECAKGKVPHIILDNYSARKSKETNGYLTSDTVKDRFVLYFIPTHSSWLNMVERWLRAKSPAEITNIGLKSAGYGRKVGKARRGWSRRFVITYKRGINRGASLYGQKKRRLFLLRLKKLNSPCRILSRTGH